MIQGEWEQKRVRKRTSTERSQENWKIKKTSEMDTKKRGMNLPLGGANTTAKKANIEQQDANHLKRDNRGHEKKKNWGKTHRWG